MSLFALLIVLHDCLTRLETREKHFHGCCVPSNGEIQRNRTCNRDQHNTNLEPARFFQQYYDETRPRSGCWPIGIVAARGENFRLDVPSKARNAAAFLPDRRSGNFPTRFDDATFSNTPLSYLSPFFFFLLSFQRERERMRSFE